MTPALLGRQSAAPHHVSKRSNNPSTGSRTATKKWTLCRSQVLCSIATRAKHESADDQPPDAEPPDSADIRLYEVHDPEQIGGEYGQGFVQFTGSVEPEILDVDTLNEKLAVKGRLRLRHAMKPDEGYGMVFNFDGIVCDTTKLKHQAWQQVADERGLSMPSVARPQMYNMSAERAAMQVLRWTQDMNEARAIAHDVAGAYAQQFKSVVQPEEGVTEWLEALAGAKVPCAIVSSLDRLVLLRVLEQLGIHRRFECSVTAEDGMETRSQQLLSACLKLGRPPNQCVAFVADPTGITAAHNASLRAVAVQGCHPGYKLGAADLTCNSLQDLTVYNLRRLFANAGNELMDLLKATDNKQDTKHRQAAVGLVDPD